MIHRRISHLFFAAASMIAIPLRAQCAPRVQRLIDDGKYENAQTVLQAQLKQKPSDDAAMDCMGRLLLEQNQSADAVTWLENATKLNGKVAQHHLWLALALRAEAQKAGMPGAARFIARIKSEMEAGLALDPALIDARYALLQLAAGTPAILGGSSDKAREQAAEILKLNPIRGHIGYAFVAEQEKDYAAAEKELLAAIAVRPDSDVAYGATGAFYRRRERWADAVGMYQMQVARMSSQTARSKLSNAHYFLGIAEEKTGRRDVAASEYKAALAANPTNENAKKALASLNAN